VSYKRPESVLVVVCTRDGEFLLLERRTPAGWWQSVTGSLEQDELPWDAAVREIREETGLAADGLVDLRMSARFQIAEAWRPRFAPGVTENLEHAFALVLPGRPEVRIDPAEHLRYDWLPLAPALERATSHTDRAAIGRVRDALAGHIA
jgi:dihydroneopterin triphosphate diphosphatase